MSQIIAKKISGFLLVNAKVLKDGTNEQIINNQRVPGLLNE